MMVQIKLTKLISKGRKSRGKLRLIKPCIKIHGGWEIHYISKNIHSTNWWTKKIWKKSLTREFPIMIRKLRRHLHRLQIYVLHRSPWLMSWCRRWWNTKEQREIIFVFHTWVILADANSPGNLIMCWRRKKTLWLSDNYETSHWTSGSITFGSMLWVHWCASGPG